MLHNMAIRMEIVVSKSISNGDIILKDVKCILLTEFPLCMLVHWNFMIPQFDSLHSPVYLLYSPKEGHKTASFQHIVGYRER